MFLTGNREEVKRKMLTETLTRVYKILFAKKFRLSTRMS
jgi:hypothetical protein